MAGFGDKIRAWAWKIGTTAALIAVVSMIAQAFGYEHRWLRGLMSRAPLEAWAIRLGLFAVGTLIASLSRIVGRPDDGHGTSSAFGTVRLVDDPRFFYLLGWVRERTGAVVDAFQGPKVAHLAIWNELGLSVDAHGGAPAFAVAFVEGLPAGRVMAMRHLSSGHIEARSVTAEAWASAVPVAAVAA